jgi:hypothetical protein
MIVTIITNGLKSQVATLNVFLTTEIPLAVTDIGDLKLKTPVRYELVQKGNISLTGDV